MLTTFVFGTALLFSMLLINGKINDIKTSNNGFLILDAIVLVVTVVLWSYLFYLLH